MRDRRFQAVLMRKPQQRTWVIRINGGRPVRHPAGALRAFKFAPGKFVELPAPASRRQLGVL